MDNTAYLFLISDSKRVKWEKVSGLLWPLTPGLWGCRSNSLQVFHFAGERQAYFLNLKEGVLLWWLRGEKLLEQI